MARRAEPVKVLHVLGGRGGIGGAERVLAAIVNAPGPVTHEVLVPFASPVGASAIFEMMGNTPVQAFGANRLWHIPAARTWVRARIRESKPDVVHSHLFHAAALVATLPHELGVIRLLTHHHGAWLRGQGRHLEEYVDRWAGARMDLVIAVSQSVRRFLTEEYGYPLCKVESIRNGWQGRPHKETGRGANPTIVCVANFRLEKGHDVLLKGLVRVTEQLPGTQLLLVGEGPRQAELRRLTERLGLVDDVRFVGAVNDVWPWLAQAHVFALASTHEPLGIAVMEAMAAGLPVIASRVGGIPELVRDGVTGSLITPGDSNAMADGLIRVLESPELRSRMGAAARQVAMSMTVDTMLHEYAELYQRLRRSGSSGVGAPVG